MSSHFKASALSRSVVALALDTAGVGGTTAQTIQATKADIALPVYGERPIKVEDLKSLYGEALVSKLTLTPKTWIVDKHLYLDILYDSFSYEENDRGELVEMTGFIMGPCDKMLKSYFQAALPLEIAGQGRPLLARVSTSTIKIEVPPEPSGSFPHFGNQSVTLDYRGDYPPAPCTMTRTFRRRAF